MATIPGLTLSKSTVRQQLDLDDLLGVSFVGERGLRQRIAQRVIDYMKERTQEANVDVNGRAFAPYSKAYTESTVFKLLKGNSKDVNMTLTANMLADVDVLSESSRSITVGFRDPTEILKAYNHNVGDTVPRRQFFGVTKKELSDLVQSDFAEDIQRLKGGSVRTVRDILSDRAAAAADAVRGGLTFRTVRDVLGG